MTTPQNGYTKLLELWNQARALDKKSEDSLANLQYGFWHAGNTLDTFMDYYQRAQPAGYVQEAANRTEEAIGVFARAVCVYPAQPPADPPKDAWWDDYGWWGIALLKAFAITTTLKYRTCAEACWQFMDKGGRHHPGTPDEKNGTWNQVSGGQQNLITNALFLNLSARLYGLTHEPKYLDGACEQYGWFRHWFDRGALHPVLPKGNLVYPRCGINESVNDASIRNYKGHYWTGDQGAVIGALAALLPIAADAGRRMMTPSTELANYLTNTCNSIVDAVTSNGAMVDQGKGVLIEPEWHDLNGAVGKGTLMRYLVAWVKAQGITPAQKTFIVDNAVAATTHPDSDGYFRFSWADIPGPSIEDDEGEFPHPTLQQLIRQCAGQDAYNASLLVA